MSTALLDLTFGLLLVLTLRHPARRLFGAGAAFTLWLLPPLLLLLSWLPLAPPHWISEPVMRVLPSRATAIWTATSAAPDMPSWPLRLWLAGSAVGIARLALHYLRLLRQVRPLPPAMQRALLDTPAALDMRRLRLHRSGPAVLWAPRSLLLLPPDFLERFDVAQRRLVLQHERMHLQRGDALWSVLAELAFALLWFHPLAWLALPRLRLDQELACDEGVLRASPQDEAGYAHTLLHSAGMDVMPVLIPWLSRPQLKERIRMIQSRRPGALRRRIGFVALAALMAGGACVVQAATQHTPSAHDHASSAMAFEIKTAPAYPESAIKNHQQGTVVLDILVGVDGKPISLTVNQATKASPELVKAASDAAMHWQFTPEKKHGKPIQSYARIPVTFDLDVKPAAKPAGTAPKSA